MDRKVQFKHFTRQLWCRTNDIKPEMKQMRSSSVRTKSVAVLYTRGEYQGDLELITPNESRPANRSVSTLIYKIR